MRRKVFPSPGAPTLYYKDAELTVPGYAFERVRTWALFTWSEECLFNLDSRLCHGKTLGVLPSWLKAAPCKMAAECWQKLLRRCRREPFVWSVRPTCESKAKDVKRVYLIVIHADSALGR